ncbi:hypothetical protein Patl1_33545 [Pistacia atlantica]|uniref:Uncharacterized protein n=1 Tax=Pistacia atlantica TaxID=434234 RepID=A0ACC0ZR04_9ROSI|nr:hypothetical protein Patl1_33545 [Pistacia atlantica]
MGIDARIEPIMNLKGYGLGNPVTDENKDKNSRIQFAYLKALITHEIYESAKTYCKGEYVNVDPSNGLCKLYLQNVTEVSRTTLLSTFNKVVFVFRKIELLRIQFAVHSKFIYRQHIGTWM